MAARDLALALWKRSLPFRLLTFAAVAMTLVAMVGPKLSGMLGGGAQQVQNPPGGGGGGGGTPTPPAPQLPAYCALPGAGGGPQSPMVVGSQVPSNVTVTPVAPTPSSGMSLDTQSRYTRFYTKVDAAATEPREGEGCARMQDAVSVLSETDYAYADCFPDGRKKLLAAQACTDKFADSEARFARLIQAQAAAARDGSATRIEALAQSRADMIPFDETRERWKEIATQRDAGDRAIAQIAASDARIDALRAAATAASGTPTPAQVEALARTASLESIDLPRLDNAGTEMLEAARAARQQVEGSQARLDALGTALGVIASGSQSARDQLIAAVSALTPFDTARATPEEAQKISAAQSEAAKFALQDLMREAGSFDPATAPPAKYESLRDLRAVVMGHGGVTEPSPEAQAALATAQNAEAVLAQSDQRIAAMRQMMEAVDKGGPAAYGSQVVKAYDAITAFDEGRMSDADLATYRNLGAAKDVSLATEKRVLTTSVPLFLRTESTDPLAQRIVEALRDGLRSAGYQIVAAEEQSAVAFSITVGEIRRNTVKFQNSKIDTAEIEVSAIGQWTFAKEALPIQRAEGVGRGRSAAEDAIADATEVLVDQIDAMARGRQ